MCLNSFKTELRNLSNKGSSTPKRHFMGFFSRHFEGARAQCPIADDANMHTFYCSQ